MEESKLDDLENIINYPKPGQVQINLNVNKGSNFVMCTYWWGRGNQNNNIARPCIDFYETYVNYIVKIITAICKSSTKESFSKLTGNEIIKLGNVKNFVRNISKKYIDMIYENFKVDNYPKAIALIEKTRKPESYVFKEIDEVQYELFLVIDMILKVTKNKIVSLVEIDKDIQNFISSDRKNKSDATCLYDRKKKLLSDIKKLLKKKQKLSEEYKNMNIFDVLNKKLRYLNSITYEKMIENWIKSCKSHKCNYLVIEYPEFVSNYQLSINAKPLFIKKALEMVHDKSVVYIDGDMLLRKYPSIFDMKDIDFMARGWWIDPRSSYKMNESITYDPYTFETSGGTMFFSQSFYSKKLLDEWINETKKQPQKADDRILSLVFNTKKYLLDMKIIQLPVEYLWLSMSYDDRILELVYDYDVTKMNSSIFIEHPECLTTEDTATNVSQSSTDRQPKFYQFLEQTDPVSEQIFIDFLSDEERTGLKDYLEYMSEVQYINDDNPTLIKKKFISDKPENNEYPLYVTKESVKSQNNFQLIKSGNFKRVNVISLAGVEIIKEFNILTILDLLLEGKTVIYDRDENIIEKSENYNKEYINNDYEFLFTPDIKDSKFQSYFRPEIDFSKPICFKPSQILINFISLFNNGSEMSELLNYGAYHFISKIRIKYVFYKKSDGRKSRRKSRGRKSARKSTRKSTRKSGRKRKSFLMKNNLY